MNDDLKSKFLELLDDEVIKEKIRNILNQENVSNDNNENLNYRYNQLLDEINKLRENITILNLENENLKKSKIDNEVKIEIILDEKDKLLNESNNLINKINELESYFKDEKEIYRIYKSLSQEEILKLKGIFKDTTIENFLYCGIQYKNIEALWEYIKNKVINGHLDEIEKLKKIFEFFLKKHNKIYDKPIYKLQEVSIGDNFDEDYHVRGFNSKISGEIKEIYLLGYINLITGNYVKKSIVKV